MTHIKNQGKETPDIDKYKRHKTFLKFKLMASACGVEVPEYRIKWIVDHYGDDVETFKLVLKDRKENPQNYLNSPGMTGQEFLSRIYSKHFERD